MWKLAYEKGLEEKEEKKLTRKSYALNYVAITPCF